MTFEKWLNSHKNKKTAIGDLARDADMKEGDTIESLWMDMIVQGACLNAKNTFKRAVNKYFKE